MLIADDGWPAFGKVRGYGKDEQKPQGRGSLQWNPVSTRIVGAPRNWSFCLRPREDGMDHSTTLQNLPDDVAFPEHLRARIGFDRERQRLTFRGFMTKCAYDELVGLANDTDYRRAVEQLFVLSSEEVGPSRPRRVRPLTLAVTVVGSIVIAMLVAWAMFRQASDRDTRSVDVQLTNSVGKQ
jgi:hypothetical protein